MSRRFFKTTGRSSETDRLEMCRDNEFDLVDFARVHFRHYVSWFADQNVRDALGEPPDRDWLEFVLADQVGRQFACLSGEELVAVVGVTRPNLTRFDGFVLTDIAVAPTSRRKRVGACVLSQLIRRLNCRTLIAYVEPANVVAQRFFAGLSWTLRSETPDADGMLAYLWTKGADASANG